MYKTRCVKKYAFSLVELSIVLVILGLLVGGILAGKSLIRASELKSVSGDFNKHQTAIYAFRDKYFGLPGDITNAYSFWGGTLGCTNVTVTAGTPAGCNGNGDSQIDYYAGERFRLWQQLATAGLIEGSYSGTHTANAAVVGTNVPTSKIANTGFDIIYYIPNTFLGWQNSMQANYMHFGTQYAGDAPIAPSLRPEEAWNIDTKLDDGMPGTGRYLGGRAYNGSWGTCTTGVMAAATYVLTSEPLGCGMAYRLL